MGIEHMEFSAKEIQRVKKEKQKKLLEQMEKTGTRSQKEMYLSIPERFQYLFLQVHFGDKGTPANRIKLKCIDCANWQPAEVTECIITSCSIWPIRPYR